MRNWYRLFIALLLNFSYVANGYFWGSLFTSHYGINVISLLAALAVALPISEYILKPTGLWLYHILDGTEHA